MGAYQIWYIEFKNKQDRDKFEKLIPKKMCFKLRRLFQYDLKEIGKGYDCTYYMGFLGYAEGNYALDLCKKNKLKLIKFLSLDLSTQSRWFNEMKEKTV